MSSAAKMPGKKKENEDNFDDDFVDDKPVAVRRPSAKPSVVKKAKKEVTEGDIDALVVKKKPANGGSDKKKGAKKEKDEEVKDVKTAVKKEKKVYEVPGQKRDQPDERDPLRIFYESLYEQVPSSEMAQIWMMESGLLSADVAKEVHEKKQKKTQTVKSPAKTPSSTKTAATTRTKSVTVKRELSSTAKLTKSVTLMKEQPSSADASKKKKTPDAKITSKPSKKRNKAGDVRDDDESDDDFEVVSRLKKRELAG